MDIAIITGSAGLIGSEAVTFFSGKFDLIIGIDNNLRKYFFGEDGSVDWNVTELVERFPNYRHFDVDINQRDRKLLLLAQLRNADCHG